MGRISPSNGVVLRMGSQARSSTKEGTGIGSSKSNVVETEGGDDKEDASDCFVPSLGGGLHNRNLFGTVISPQYNPCFFETYTSQINVLPVRISVHQRYLIHTFVLQMSIPKSLFSNCHSQRMMDAHSF